MSNSSAGNRPKRILLGHLASNGDCLYATTVARQIKADYPGCHLTWAIGSGCQSIIKNNPDVDAVWVISKYEHPHATSKQYEPNEWIKFEETAWRQFENEAMERKRKGEFDEVFFTQISPGRLENLAGSTRTSTFRGYPHPITVDKTPVLRLTPEEVENVRQFAQTHQLSQKKHVILFECSPRSGQSSMNLQFALEVARRIVEKRNDVAFILSTNHSFDSPSPNIIAGSALSLRENAELTKYCTLLIGASSGITWISTSDWAKPLPMLQLIHPDVASSNSLVYDYEERGADTSNVIEMNTYTVEDVYICLNTIFDNSFVAAKSNFNQKAPLGFNRYTDQMRLFLFNRQFKKAFQVFKLNIKEYGFRPQFVLIPLYIPPRWLFLRLKKLISKRSR